MSAWAPVEPCGARGRAGRYAGRRCAPKEWTMLNRLVGTDNDPAGLVMRLALGLVMFPHGAQKVLGWFGGHGFSATLESFAKLGLPPPLTMLVLAAELGGSLLLI